MSSASADIYGPQVALYIALAVYPSTCPPPRSLKIHPIGLVSLQNVSIIHMILNNYMTNYLDSIFCFQFTHNNSMNNSATVLGHGLPDRVCMYMCRSGGITQSETTLTVKKYDVICI